MPIYADFSALDDILIVRAEGLFDAESDERFDRAVAQQCNEQGFKKVLIDFRKVEGMPATLDSYHSGANLSTRGFSRNTRLAFLDRPEFQEANAFYELVARNRGFYLRHFYTEEEALAWLQD